MLNLQRLLVLHELDRRGTLAAVAKSLAYSPSAVSQQLAQLEREAGVPLTEPIGRGVRLTDAARLLVEHTRVAIAELEQAETELARVHGRVTGRLHAASFQSVALALLPGVLALLGRRHAELRVDVAHREVEDATSGLLSGEFDVVLGEEYPGRSLTTGDRMHRVDLGSDELLLAVPLTGPWSGARSVDDLVDAPWAIDPEHSAPGIWAREVCRRAGFEPDVRFDGIDLLTHLHLVQTGHAVSLLPALLGPERTAGVALLPLPGGPRRELFTLTRAARAGHPAVGAFRDALGTVFLARDETDAPRV